MNAIYGDALRQYREERDLSLRDVAQMLGVSSPSTVKSWEDGQDIPGPVQLLLRMLIHGELPFAKPAEDTSAEEEKHFWQLKLTLADWHKLESLAAAAGFATVRDYLLSLIQEHLASEGFAGQSYYYGNNNPVCQTPYLNVATVISSETDPKAQLLPTSGAPIVPLPTAHWSGAGKAAAKAAAKAAEIDVQTPVSDERQAVGHEVPKRRKK
jgi:transcriptional regulator with XRE-family HTH domain